jgi:hypothetical protein
MKIKNLLGFLTIFAFASIAFSQTVVITPKKTVYTRKGKVSFKEMRTFSVTYPVVSSAISAPIKKKLENTINYWRAFEMTLAENLSADGWLTDLSYQVNYNKNGILDISLFQEGVGAYPTSETINLVVDLKTGEQVKFAEVFKTDSTDKLAQLVDRKLELEKKEIIKGIETDNTDYKTAEDRQNDVEMIDKLTFTSESFNEFLVNDKGVIILYDAGFPHAIQALQPDGRYFFSWAELKPFVKTNGLLGKFVK